MESLVKQENEPTDVSVKDHMLDQELLDAQAGADMAGMQSMYQWEIYNQLLAAGHDPDQAKDWVLEHVEPDPPVESPRFQVTDMKSADWVLKKLAELDASEAEIAEMVQANHDSIDQRAERILEPIRRSRTFFYTVFAPQIEEWAKKQLAGKKTKSEKLIHGVVGFQKKPDSLVIDDGSDAAMDALETMLPEAIKTTRSILKTPIKKLLEGSERTELHVPASMLTGDDSGPSDDESRLIAHIEPGENEFYIKPACRPNKNRKE